MPADKSRREGEPTPRHEARERAVGLLYEAEVKHVSPGVVLDSLAAPPDPFAVMLVRGVDRSMARIDELLGGAAANWDVGRMAAVDRAILRLGVYQLLAEHDIPVAVVIDEAVELAKRYSTEESGAFVNGVLSSVAATLAP